MDNKRLSVAFTNGDVDTIYAMLSDPYNFIDVNYQEKFQDFQTYPMRLCHSSMNATDVGEMMKLLFQCDADANLQDSSGKTVLSHACISQNCDLIRIICSEGRCDPNIPDLGGNTPVFYAVSSRNVKVVRELMDATERDPVNLLVVNKSGMTAAHEAKKLGLQQIVKILTDKHKSSKISPTRTQLQPLYNNPVSSPRKVPPIVIPAITIPAKSSHKSRRQPTKPVDDIIELNFEDEDGEHLSDTSSADSELLAAPRQPKNYTSLPDLYQNGILSNSSSASNGSNTSSSSLPAVVESKKRIVPKIRAIYAIDENYKVDDSQNHPDSPDEYLNETLTTERLKTNAHSMHQRQASPNRKYIQQTVLSISPRQSQKYSLDRMLHRQQVKPSIEMAVPTLNLSDHLDTVQPASIGKYSRHGLQNQTPRETKYFPSPRQKRQDSWQFEHQDAASNVKSRLLRNWWNT